MKQKLKFRIVYTDEAINFLESLPPQTKDKVVYNISKNMFVVDKEIFKKLGYTEIWEFRTLYNGMAYQLFSFWDTDGETLVVATHGMIKKNTKDTF